MLTHTPKLIALIAVLSALVIGSILACGGTFEPTPDIPEHVEYDTVRFEYGEGDGLSAQSADGTMRAQPLIGQPSFLARMTFDTVSFTNQILQDQFKLVEDIKRYPVTRYEDGKWIWESQDARDGYIRFEIVTLQKPAALQDELNSAYGYLLYVGNNKSDHALVYSAEFYQFDQRRERGNAQRGFGHVRFFFDALQKYRPDSPHGTLRIAFRSRNLIRQVRVNFNGVRERVGDERLRALYQYTQLADNQGRMTYFGRGDYKKDGEPYEFLGAHAAWSAEQEGHVAASISGGSLEIERILLRECWDMAGDTVFARSQPNIPDYEGGQLEDCALGLQTVEVSAPEYTDPGDVDPEIPGRHPQE